MTTRATRVGVGGTALAAVLLLAGAACSEDNDGDDDTSQSGPGSSGVDTPPVATQTSFETVSGRLDALKRTRVKDAVNEIVDQWFDGAFLGDFPRSDYSAAFGAFTDGAQADALSALDLMSNQAISDRIDTATAINRRVRLDVFAPEGRPRGVSARFVLDFSTDGELDGPRRVAGSLYLIKRLGEWHVFGYDVLEVVSR